MTASGDRIRKRKIILAIAAVTAVTIIAAAGFWLIGEKKYNDQIEIAEKALAEGNYEQAETSYLSAIGMRKRKPKAREGLAYTYALESRFNESAQVYNDLYQDTKEEKYLSAASSVSEGMIPMYNELFSGEGIWIGIDLEQIPKDDELTYFLGQYCSFSWFFGRDKDPSTWYEFDSESPEKSYAFPLTHFMTNEDYFPEYADAFEYHSDEPDPKEWADPDMLYFQRIAKDVADRIYTVLFNVDESKIESVLAEAESRGLMYLDGGYYYEFITAMGFGGMVARIERAFINGDRCCVKYTAVSAMGDGREYGTYYAVMKMKLIDGKMLWTMLYNSTEAPADLTDYLNNTDKSSEESDIAIELNEEEKHYIAATVAPFIDAEKGLIIETLTDEEIADCVSYLIEVGYGIDGTSNIVPFDLVYLEGEPWNHVNGESFLEAAKYVYGRDIDGAEALDHLDDSGGFMRGDEVTGGSDVISVDGTDIHRQDYLQMPPNGRGHYYGIVIDQAEKKNGDVIVQYHIDAFDYDMNSTSVRDNCKATLRPTENKKYPYTLISIGINEP